MESQTEQNARLVVYDVSDKLHPVYLSEYVVPLPFYEDYTAKASKNPKVAAQSELHALPNGQFFVLARDGGFGHGQDESLSVYRHIDVFDISEATDIKGDTYDCETCAVADDDGNLDDDITPATYCSFLDFNVNGQLERFGAHNGGEQDSFLLVSAHFLRVPSKTIRQGAGMLTTRSSEREMGVHRAGTRGPCESRNGLLRHQPQ